MSYILDALKKIEQEKNRKRPDGRVSISGDLFQERKQPNSGFGIRKTAAIIAVASLVTCAGTWFVLHGNSKKSTAIIRPVATSPPSAPSTPSTPATPSPLVSVNPPVATPPVSVNPPVAAPPVSAPVQPRPTPAAVPPAAPIAAVPAAGAVEDDDSLAREARRSRKRIKAQPPSPNQPAQAVQTPADIKLSGIAWQEERKARMAVVNGFLLKEGAVVSGAKIIEIKADRVRFSSSAGQFEIKLDAVIPAELKK